MGLKLFLMADFPRFGFPSGAATWPQCCRAPGLAPNPAPIPSTPRESSWFPRTLRTSLQDRQKERCSEGFFCVSAAQISLASDFLFVWRFCFCAENVFHQGTSLCCFQPALCRSAVAMSVLARMVAFAAAF